MKKLFDIIEGAKSNRDLPKEDLQYAVCAMDSLMTFNYMALSDLATAEKEGKKPILTNSARFQFEENFRRVQAAGAKTPKEWLGWDNDPANPEYQQRRQRARKLMDRVMTGKAPKARA